MASDRHSRLGIAWPSAWLRAELVRRFLSTGHGEHLTLGLAWLAAWWFFALSRAIQPNGLKQAARAWVIATLLILLAALCLKMGIGSPRFAWETKPIIDF